MNDNNFRDIIGARLEEIHMAETMPETMPSEEDLLRWETLAKARTADRKRKTRRFISIAAVFLLAVVIGVAVIVGPPDAEAGGEGNAVIVDGGVSVLEYDSIGALTKKVGDKFILLDNNRYGLKTKTIRYMETKNVEQVEIVYKSDLSGELSVTEIIAKDDKMLQNDLQYFDRKENWGNVVVHIAGNPNNDKEATYMFACNNIYVIIYSEDDAQQVRKIIEEAFDLS